MRKKLVAMISVLASCTAPKWHPPTSTAPEVVYASPEDFDKTWSAIVTMFAESTTPVETIEKDSGYIAAARPIVFTSAEEASKAVDFGKLDSTDFTSVYLSNSRTGAIVARYNVLLSESDSHPLVKVSTSWTTSYEWFDIWWGRRILYGLEGVSKGAVEHAILLKLALKLGDHDPDIRVIDRSTAR